MRHPTSVFDLASRLALLRLAALSALLVACAAADRRPDPDAGARCYSPDQNLDLAYEPSAVGCGCDASDQEQCIGRVALVCDGERWLAVEDGPCEPQELPSITVRGCTAEGAAVAVFDPGDGSLERCPRGEAIGALSGAIEGGLCCKLEPADCATPAVALSGDCGDGPPYFWNGSWCRGSEGCECTGDCNSGFDSEQACLDAYRPCAVVAAPCQGFDGPQCADDEYCAYGPLGVCGAGSGAPSVCVPRPEACDEILLPVCGCDNETYPNACEAAAAGTGFSSFGECT